MIAESEVQDAVTALLKANTDLMAVATGIFDLNNIPSTQTFPYVVLGETTMAFWDAFGDDQTTGNGQDITLAIHSWSKYLGKRQLATVRGEIYKSLHGTKLSMTHYVGTMAFDSGNAMEDDSTSIKLIHGTDRYRIRVREIAQ